MIETFVFLFAIRGSISGANACNMCMFGFHGCLNPQPIRHHRFWRGSERIGVRPKDHRTTRSEGSPAFCSS